MDVIAAAAVVLIFGTIVWATRLAIAEIRAAREDARRARVLDLLEIFTPAIAAGHQDPRALLVWVPIARAARALFPEEIAQIDRAIGATFPFSADALQAAHARWTTDWLAWERGHDAEYKRKAAEAEHDLASAEPSLARARLDAIEREKLDLYQRRYEEYVRIARALQGMSAV